MSTDPLQLCARPPTAQLCRIWQGPSKPETIVILAFAIGHWVHWLKKRSTPCEKEKCPLCKRRVPARWQGYAPGAVRILKLGTDGHKASWEQFVIPVSPEFDDMLLSAGEVPLVAEVKPRPNAKGFEVSRLRPIKSDEGLPKPFSVEPVLYRVFGIRPSESVPQPTPERE